MPEKIHIGTIKVVNNINKIEIPSTPSLKLIKPLIQFFSSINWKSAEELSNKYQRIIDRKKLAIEVKIATYLEFFSIFFCVPLVIKIKRAPINGMNIIDDRIGKFI
tara:strand:- start:46 stop:363 length:318 start_codon:yes stop_codon:yes gene_type:complete